MSNWTPRPALLTAALLAGMLTSVLGRAAPQSFDLGTYGADAVQGPIKPRECTVTYLVEDYVSNETFAARMRFSPAPDAVAGSGSLPCPELVPLRVAQSALAACRDHAANPSDCVFADMNLGFDASPSVDNTSDSASRCQSDHAAEIGLACWNNGKFDVCSVGCGATARAAIQTARSRCEANHQTTCAITGSVPVQAP